MASGDSRIGASATSRPIDGRAVVLLRAYRNLSRKKLADLTKIDRRALARIEKGKQLMESDQRTVIARELRVPETAFEDVSEMVGYLDRIVGEGTFWSGSHRPRISADDAIAGGVGEGTAFSRRLQRREHHLRIAEAAGRSTKLLVLGLFDAIDGGSYDEL